MKKELLFSGIGGQGVITLGEALCDAAIKAGFNVTFVPFYGQEKRGGREALWERDRLFGFQKADFAAGNVAQQARDGAKRGGFSCAVGADQRYDLTIVDLQADSLQGVDLAVVKVQVPDLQYFLRHPVHLPGMLQ